MAQVYRDPQAKPTALAKKTVAVLGFGNQGRAQALNLRDSGVPVIVGNIADDYAERAKADGFAVYALAEAVRRAEVMLILLPDELLPKIWGEVLAPALRPGHTLAFASGYNIAYDRIKLPSDVDVVLLAPRMIGEGVRAHYLSRRGFFSFIGVHQDATGNAQQTLLGLAAGIGTLWRGAVECTFQMEAELDLFNEQGFGPAFGRVLLGAMETLLEAGYPPEVVLLEIYLSGEMEYIMRDMAETGLVHQLDHHSTTSQYGALSRGMRFLGVDVKSPMRGVLRDIRRGSFAREWAREQSFGRWWFSFLKSMAHLLPMRRLEKQVRAALGLDQPADTGKPAVSDKPSR